MVHKVSADKSNEYFDTGGHHIGAVVQGLISESGPFCVEFVCSPCVCVGSLQIRWLPPTYQLGVG